MRPWTSMVCALSLLGLASAAGCATGSRGEASPAPFDVTVEGAKRLNPDEEGQSLPTSVRLYQLRSSGKMEAAEFDQVYRKEKETLGEDFVHVDEVTVSPGEKVKKTILREPGARALAAVAVVRRPSGTTWRAIVELPSGSPGPVTFVVEDFRVTAR
jgi:type VI secretion system protein VasD